MDLFANNAGPVYFDDISIDITKTPPVPALNMWGLMLLIMSAIVFAGFQFRRVRN